MMFWSTSLLHALALVAVVAHSADVAYNQSQLAHLMSELEGNRECTLQLPTSLSEPTTKLHAIPDQVILYHSIVTLTFLLRMRSRSAGSRPGRSSADNCCCAIILHTSLITTASLACFARAGLWLALHSSQDSSRSPVQLRART